MKTHGAALGILAWGCLLVGCGQQQADTNAAIKAAIEEHLAGLSGLSADNMTMDIKDVRVKGEQAEADVVFRTTNGPPAQMAFLYHLRKEGNRWRVDQGSPGDASSPHQFSPAPESSGEEQPPMPEGHPQ